MNKAWRDKHMLHLYGALSSNEASVLAQARMEHCGLNAYLFRKKTVRRASTKAAMRQWYMCCCAPIGILKPARCRGKR
jgi:hypothetical protein